MLRACYTTSIRPYRNSDREEEITWFFVPADRPLCGYGRFASGNYTNASDEWPGPGEVKGRPRQYAPGREPFRLAHHEPEGPRDWWINGCPVEAAGTLPRSRRGAAPEHCIGGVPGFVMGGAGRFASARVGGFMLGGATGIERRFTFASSGGFALDGQAVVTSSTTFTSAGGFELGGEAVVTGNEIGGFELGGEADSVVLEPFQTDCCPNPIQQTLFLIIAGTTGIYTPIEGVRRDLRLQPSRRVWENADTLLNNQDTFIETPSFQCTPTGWELHIVGMPGPPSPAGVVECAGLFWAGSFANEQGSFSWFITGRPLHVSFGGFELGGEAGTPTTSDITTEGGFEFDGEAVVTSATTFVSAGGFELGGESFTPTTSELTSEGGFELGGEAQVTSSTTFVSAGGFELGGQAVVTSSTTFVSAGGFELDGEAVVASSTTFVSAGGFELGGQASVTSSTTLVSGGGFELDGQASVTSSTTLVSAGGFELDGQAVVTSSTTFTSAGGFELDGQAVSAVLDPVEEVMPIGTIVMWGGTAAPTKWLLCQGQTVAKATYPALWAAIGDNFLTGSALPNDFSLPDLQGRAPIGTGQGSGLTNRTLNQKMGGETHQLVTAEIPGHVHQQVSTDGSGGSVVGLASYSAGTVKVGRDTTSGEGGSGSHNNMQPSRVVNFIIKALD